MDQGQQQPAQQDAAIPAAVTNAAAQPQQQPDGMAGVVPTQPFTPAPDAGAVSLANAAAVLPGTLPNGQPSQAVSAPNAISAGKLHQITTHELLLMTIRRNCPI